MVKELKAEELKLHIPKDLPETTKEVEPLESIVSQERVLDAIKSGIDIEEKGFNIYISGLNSPDRLNIVKELVEKLTQDKESKLYDFCYVYNFKNPEEPRILIFPAGEGKKFKERMDNLVEILKKDIRKALTDSVYEKKISGLRSELNSKIMELEANLKNEVSSFGFVIVSTQTGGFDVGIPIMNNNIGRQVVETKLDRLKGIYSEEEIKNLKNTQNELRRKLKKVGKQIMYLKEEYAKKEREVKKEWLFTVVESPIEALKQLYPDNEKVKEHLEEMKEDVVTYSSSFEGTSQQNVMGLLGLMGGSSGNISSVVESETFGVYDVNIVVDNSGKKRRPVIVETNPSFLNLNGKIEKISSQGIVHSDFRKIKAGSIAKSSGGYLIVDVYDLLRKPKAWEVLKRTLKTGEVKIEDIYENIGVLSSVLDPQPIPVKLKVIMLGDEYAYYVLSQYDEDFKELFKIKAQFDPELDLEKGTKNYVSFAAKVVKEKELPPIDKTGLEAIIEYGARLAGRREKLAELTKIEEVIVEAGTLAKKGKKDVVTRKDVEKAIEAKTKRHSLYMEKYQEVINKGLKLIETDGEKIGQINGLVYYDADFAFGAPIKITAVTSVGRNGIVSIEKETGLSKKIHNKGVFTIEGYLRHKFGQDMPLSVHINLAFEQLYNYLDGDSASSTELYAILSSLAGAPIKQGIAVTGSVNQFGEIQPIGGVNEKIEGFFDICKARGLTGEQGVIIPEQNVNDLVLKKEVVKAVEEGKFHIYPVKRIEEGIEILTGKPFEEIATKVKEKLKTYLNAMKNSE